MKFSRQAVYGISDEEYVSRLPKTVPASPIEGMIAVLKLDLKLLYAHKDAVSDFYKGVGDRPRFCYPKGQDYASIDSLERLLDKIKSKITSTSATIKRFNKYKETK